MTFALVGLDLDAKAEWVTEALFERLGGRDRFEAVDVRRTATADGALLTVTVRDPDPSKVGRAFSGAAVELVLANYPRHAHDGAAGERVVLRRLLARARAGRAGRARRGAARRHPGGHPAVTERAATGPAPVYVAGVGDGRAHPGGAARHGGRGPVRATRGATPTSACGSSRRGRTPGWRSTSPSTGSRSCCPRRRPSRSAATSCPTCGP